MKRLRGVTLIELLVVVAIAALLMSIITPSLKIVKEKAALVKCANNQYQIVLAVSGYASEWGGRLPAPVTVNGTPDVLWRTSDVNGNEEVADAFTVLGNYLPSAEIFNCRWHLIPKMRTIWTAIHIRSITPILIILILMSFIAATSCCGTMTRLTTI